jgi:plastocyanin
VYPTGSSHHDATVSVYINNIVVEVIIVNINVTIINGATTTIYSTKTDSAHSTSTPPPTTSTTSSAPTIHTVIVGVDGTLAYGANQVDAAIGDIIRFDFNSTNHTVTQSDFNTPCSPKAGGFNTGFNQFNPTNHTGVIFKDFVVDVSTPLWFYCAQTVKVSHCHKGMVLGVNPAGKFPAFLSLATATSTAITTSTSGTTFSTGKSGAISTGVSKPSSTSSVSIPLGTGVPKATTGSIITPQPTFVGGTHFKGRRAGQAWFA